MVPMFKSLQNTWRHFRDAEPGQRFLLRYREHKSGTSSKFSVLISVTLGLALLAAGVLGLVFPGPGLLGLALGAAVLAQESEKASKALDRLELWIRRQVTAFKRWWGRAGLLSKFLVTAAACIVGFAGAAAVGYFFIRKFFD
jgi:hypothetical protein